MPMDRFFIAPYDKNSGLRNDLKPWLIPDEAFSRLMNAYVFRGRVRKRFGSRWMGPTQLNSRFRMSLVPAGLIVTTPQNIAVGQIFSIGADIFTVTNITPPYPVPLLSTSAVTADLTAANQVTFSAIAGTVYWYPALPVMGLVSFETSSINNEPVIGFDKRYAYQFTAGAWERLANGSSVWTGSDSQFFWGTSYPGANAFDYVLFVTNFDEADPNFMRTLDLATLTWTNYRPQISATGPIFMDTARILVPFKNRLLAFNIWQNEGGVPRHYPFRMRFSQRGSAFPVGTAWRQDIPGKGGGLDCPANEAIITVEFVKDRLIVFLERSTWEIVYNGNQINPFAWQQINTELGAESTFSIVPFDKVALGIGNVGIVACNGSNVERIDNSIPDEVFAIHNDNGGVERVAGIRDYFVEMVYWTFPAVEASSEFPFPRAVLVYNYKTGTWAINRDSITAFGYFQPQTGITWDSTTVTWDDVITWDSGQQQALARLIVAGNQEGFVFIIDPDTTVNASVIQITNISIGAGGVITITAIDHNLIIGDFIYLTGIVGSGDMTDLNNTIQKVISISDRNTFQFVDADIAAGTYAGGGTFALVSEITMKTKEFNFYAGQARNVSVNKVDFQVDATTYGEITLDYLVSTSDESMVLESESMTGTGAIVGTNVLETSPYPSVPLEATASRLVHPIYFQADGEFIQLEFRMSDEQMQRVIEVEPGVFSGPTFEDFQLHSMCFFAQPTSSRMQ